MKNAIYLLVLIFFSCNYPEHYSAPKPDCADKESTADKLDQKQIITLLKSKSIDDFRYFFKTFTDQDEMVVNFRNDAFCFNVAMVVKNWEKLESMKKVNGQSYPEELHEVQWVVKEVGGTNRVVFLDMHPIID